MHFAVVREITIKLLRINNVMNKSEYDPLF